MKSQIYKRLAFVAMLFSLVFFVTNATAKKPVKPPPDTDQTTAECILFTGYLETVPGSEEVEGCCPNAGPWPDYTMTLGGTAYDGQLFINFVGTGPRAQYKVQFWSWDWDVDTPGDGDVFFEIIGGVIDYDKKSKFLTVSFKDEDRILWLYDDWVAEDGCCATTAPDLTVSFDLLRSSDLNDCQ